MIPNSKRTAVSGPQFDRFLDRYGTVLCIVSYENFRGAPRLVLSGHVPEQDVLIGRCGGGGAFSDYFRNYFESWIGNRTATDRRIEEILGSSVGRIVSDNFF